MTSRALEYVLDVTLRSGPERAWRIASSTDLADAAAGLPPIQYTDVAVPGDLPVRTFRYTVRGVVSEGEEAPFVWEHPRFFRVERTFRRGPFTHMVHRCDLEPGGPGRPESGTRMRHRFTLQPRGLFGRLWAEGFARTVLPAFTRYYRDEDARDPPESDWDPDLARLRSPLRRRASPTAAMEGAVRARVEEARRWHDSRLLEAVGDAVLHLEDDCLQRIRPLLLARRYGADAEDAVDTCLAATKAGLLVLRWDVVCPHCRGDKAHHTRLEQVVPRGFCPSCGIDFEVELDRALEPVFAPHPQLRPVAPARYCLGGPGTTPHVLHQQTILPGAEVGPRLDLPEGRYRLRFVGATGFRWIDVVGAPAGGEAAATDPRLAGPPSLDFEVGEQGVRGGDRVVPAAPVSLSVANRSPRPVQLILEHAAWARDALPASRMFTHQAFRDLFGTEMLAPGVGLAVGRVALVFTDLVGSTALYGRVGDARAFQAVWDHFDGLTAAVTHHGGAVVKTIGDAVMAAFPDGVEALEAAADMHEAVGRASVRLGIDLRLKVGVHEGPAIAVTSNDRLDYFGTTVNLAARVQSLARPGGIVVTTSLLKAPSAADVLSRRGWRSEPGSALPKGFAETVDVVWFERDPAGGVPSPA